MERMLLRAADSPVATIAGLAAMVCFAIWPLFRGRSAMLMTYIGNNLGFVVHYGLLGQWTAVAMNGFMSVQTVVALMLVRLPALRWGYYALIPAPILISVMTWRGLPSLLAAAATMMSTFGRMQTNEIALRILLLTSTPFWTAHDLVVGSLPGLVADLLSIATSAVMLLRCLPAARSAGSRSMKRLRHLVRRAQRSMSLRFSK
jgi:hypothetical protein